MVGQRKVAVGDGYVFQQRGDELVQVIDLLELAPRVLVELAFAREDVQLFEQFDGLAGAQLVDDLRGLGGLGGGQRLAGRLAGGTGSVVRKGRCFLHGRAV